MTALVGILAAGGSTRMRGRDKLLEDVGGEPLLARQARVARKAGVATLIALPPANEARMRIARAAGAVPVVVTADPPGMGDSIAALAAEADRRNADSLLLMLADMPEIEAGDLRALLMAGSTANPGEVVRAASTDGVPGHPVIFPRESFAGLRRLRGDAGARRIIAAAPSVLLVPLPGRRALVDLDTPEDWQAWREARQT